MNEEIMELTPIDEVYTKDESVVLNIYRFLRKHYKIVVGLVVGFIIGVLT